MGFDWMENAAIVLVLIAAGVTAIQAIARFMLINAGKPQIAAIF